jgi:LysR family transcriptional regulator of abg operon
MELRQLSHFLAVVDAGSLTLAADRVGVTQQALSKSLARLETELGGKLFERAARGMTLSRLGDAIAEHARQVLVDAARLRHAASADLGLQRGRLVVGLSPIAASSRLGDRVMRFAERYPRVRIDVESGIDREFVARLHRGEIDVAISSQTAEQTDSVLLEQLAAENWGVTGNASNALLSNARNLADLADARWIIGRNTALLDAQIAESFGNAGMAPPRPGIMTTSVLFTLQALRRSPCLAILPQSCARICPICNGVILGHGAWITPIFLMRRKRALIDDLIRALLQELGCRAT